MRNIAKNWRKKRINLNFSSTYLSKLNSTFFYLFLLKKIKWGFKYSIILRLLEIFFDVDWKINFQANICRLPTYNFLSQLFVLKNLVFNLFLLVLVLTPVLLFITSLLLIKQRKWCLDATYVNYKLITDKSFILYVKIILVYITFTTFTYVISVFLLFILIPGVLILVLKFNLCHRNELWRFSFSYPTDSFVSFHNYYICNVLAYLHIIIMV